MHNLEGFGFRSDCFSLKDNLSDPSSAFQGPKLCFRHQLCCHRPWLPCLAHGVTSWHPHCQGNGSKLQPAPLQQCVKLCLHSSLQLGNPGACRQERRTSTAFPSHSSLAINNCFIFAAFALQVCKNPNNDVVSDIKRSKKAKEIISRQFTKAPLSHGGAEEFCAGGSCCKWRE